MKRKVFIGLAWPYVNGDIHIGHLAGYLFPADIFARFHRYLGNDVIMVSGSDCFGTPITMEADKRKITPAEVVKEYHAKNVALFNKLKLSFDIYTKTDSDNHKRIVQDFFVRLAEKGYIFKDKTEQYYSVAENKFLPDRYVEGKCPHCGNLETRSDQCEKCGNVLEQGELIEPKNKLTGQSMTLKSTEHYFLDWPKFQLFLEKFVEKRNKPLDALGASWRSWVLKETLGWLQKGLKPRAITRDLDWGVEIPIDRLPENLRIQDVSSKRIYVWFEAVIGYFSASVEWAELHNRDFKDFWYNKDALHAYFMGKDNLVFHTLFWPGELYGYDEKIHLPDLPVINQFLNVEGQKFSKSRGITIDSAYIVETYGLDTVRFYLALIDPENADANFSWTDFIGKNNDILIGNFGNFINRTLTLANGLEFDGAAIDADFVAKILVLVKETKRALAAVEFKRYAETILAISDLGNKYLSVTEPWFLKEKDPKKFKTVIQNALFSVLALLLVVKPLIPDSAEELSKLLGVEFKFWPEDEFAALKKLLIEVKVNDIKPLFKKLDYKVAEFERSKLNLPK